LANKLPEINGLGGSLKAGEIVITGSPMQTVPIKIGSYLQAHFGVLKGIELTFC
jgi:2-keto-4-pentenoate hydratase